MRSHAGFAAAMVVFVSAVCFGLSEEEILKGAEGRIEKHRMGNANLVLVGPDGAAVGEGAAVKIEQTRHAFLFGCNIFKLERCRTAEDNAAYAKYFSELLNFATLPFYWWNYERRPGVRNDEQTEAIVQWCKAHNITTKGHPLAWNYMEQRWLPEEPAEAMKLQMARIARCVDRFKGDIDIWDVVNEATHYDRPFCLEQAPKLTAAIKEMGVGEYVRQAFQIARKANPEATLLISDYRTDQAYIDKVIKELVDENGKRLYDVIGIQSHMHGGYWGAKRTWDVCDTYAQFGVPLHFTETTLVSGPKTDDGWKTTPEGEERQAREAAEFYTVLFSHPAVEAITWWDFSDQGAWQGAPAGFLRDDMTPKPMYGALKDLIKGKWWTVAETTVEAGGKAAFRGFYGEYKVTVPEKGLAGSFVFNKGTTGAVKVVLK
ncbi:MAG TPA: endo-1,4-beta-xylanase [Anaerohalosphaeraceae bacterium]|jgi:endo-1,4-beta-xylanase|nr:endo-1,4-beta-xylanase [Anaerohalosphaeraceae bacterium]HRT49057.1 endo-1,4-beta-xylanase [Anaerohalosphaeraceae bacterium]HRT85690.1 endo-1,4-beta-xylanase [Anaerohalosphaeraceae bacterium]